MIIYRSQEIEIKCNEFFFFTIKIVKSFRYKFWYKISIFAKKQIFDQ